MAASLPYLPSPGSLKNALEKIRSAATPDRVTKDFVTTVLQIKGGTGAAIPPYLKKIGFVASDGAPTDLYKRFRNPATGGAAVADAIKTGYRELLQANEYFYRLSDKDLKALIVQVAGLAADDRVLVLTFSTLVTLRSFANFDTPSDAQDATPVVGNASEAPKSISLLAPPQAGKVGLNLAYTINLNLPATSDQAVFNAIFRSLKEHLLSSDE
ncbi:DUF5343 domain-containing protein [Hydrogenophaga sp. YM1]|uniref:DUF5343 domain-containing protein n=1 Tax=Hydrogenophaga sp. YM1 TaxID=2806262 RepID=UPI00195681A0|nr:DUF5343 domain-containing protein [Hydrogenophaga sp. YM1]QRR36004.1 DUF5343 domain-containing protein [Hydrogenophaga sp. YM1]